jgi:Heme/copper-type cytochrome/quinol oxidase, subunit 3
LSFREQFHFLAIRGCPDETASRFHAWLARLTILLGGIFLVGQGTEYWKLFQTGVDLSTNMFSTTFFTLLAFHGLHVLLV